MSGEDIKNVVDHVLPASLKDQDDWGVEIYEKVKAHIKKLAEKELDTGKSKYNTKKELKRKLQAIYHSMKLYKSDEVKEDNYKTNSNSALNHSNPENEDLQEKKEGPVVKIRKSNRKNRSESERKYFEYLNEYKLDPDIASRVKGIEMRGKSYKVSNDGSCPKCFHKVNVFVILDVLFISGDMPELLQYLVTKGKALLWSSKEALAKDPPTFICAGNCPSDMKKSGFNIDWNKTDLDKIYLFPETNYVNPTPKPILLPKLLPKKEEEKAVTIESPTETKKETEKVADPGLIGEKVLIGNQTSVEIANLRTAKDFELSDIKKDAKENMEDEIDFIDTEDDEEYSDEEYDEGNVDMKYYREKVSWVVIDAVGDAPDNEESMGTEKEEEMIRTMLALEEARNDFTIGEMKKIGQDRENKEAPKIIETQTEKTLIKNNYPNLSKPVQRENSSTQPKNYTTAELAALKLLNEIKSIEKTSTEAAIKEKEKEKATKKYSMSDFPISKDGACPYCHSTNVLYVIIDNGERNDALPSLLKTLLSQGKARKIPKGDYDLPSFQCNGCTYGFNLDWSCTNLEKIYFPYNAPSVSSLPQSQPPRAPTLIQQRPPMSQPPLLTQQPPMLQSYAPPVNNTFVNNTYAVNNTYRPVNNMNSFSTNPTYYNMYGYQAPAVNQWMPPFSGFNMFNPTYSGLLPAPFNNFQQSYPATPQPSINSWQIPPMVQPVIQEPSYPTANIRNKIPPNNNKNKSYNNPLSVFNNKVNNTNGMKKETKIVNEAKSSETNQKNEVTNLKKDLKESDKSNSNSSQENNEKLNKDILKENEKNEINNDNDLNKNEKIEAKVESNDENRKEEVVENTDDNKEKLSNVEDKTKSQDEINVEEMDIEEVEMEVDDIEDSLDTNKSSNLKVEEDKKSMDDSSDTNKSSNIEGDDNKTPEVPSIENSSVSKSESSISQNSSDQPSKEAGEESLKDQNKIPSLETDKVEEKTEEVNHTLPAEVTDNNNAAPVDQCENVKKLKRGARKRKSDRLKTKKVDEIEEKDKSSPLDKSTTLEIPIDNSESLLHLDVISSSTDDIDILANHTSSIFDDSESLKDQKVNIASDPNSPFTESLVNIVTSVKLENVSAETEVPDKSTDVIKECNIESPVVEDFNNENNDSSNELSAPQTPTNEANEPDIDTSEVDSETVAAKPKTRKSARTRGRARGKGKRRKK